MSESKRVNFVKSTLGNGIVARDNTNIAVRCPSCSNSRQDKKKFSINLNTWQCHCWVCGIKSSHIFFIFQKLKMFSACAEFESSFGKVKGSKIKIDEQSHEENIVSIPDGFRLLAKSTSDRDPDIKSCLSYLKKRGVSYGDLWKYKIGACTEGEFRRRIIIPSFDSTGDLNYFVSRGIDDLCRPKYINSKIPKSEIVFNEINIDWSRELVIVEGVFDLLKTTGNATCILGSTLSENSFLFKMIAANKTPVCIALDNDAKAKGLKMANDLLSFDVHVRFISVGDRDIGDMTKVEFNRLKSSAFDWNFTSQMKMKIGMMRTGSIF